MRLTLPAILLTASVVNAVAIPQPHVSHHHNGTRPSVPEHEKTHWKPSNKPYWVDQKKDKSNTADAGNPVSKKIPPSLS